MPAPGMGISPWFKFPHAMIPNLHRLLFDRLQQQGVNTDEAPALLRDLSKILESEPPG